MPSKRSAAPRSPSTSPTFPSDWQEFLSLLTSLHVKFVVVGAHAFAIHARPRMTEDLDVSIETERLLIKNKRAAGRPKDLLDIEALLAKRR